MQYRVFNSALLFVLGWSPIMLPLCNPVLLSLAVSRHFSESKTSPSFQLSTYTFLLASRDVCPGSLCHNLSVRVRCMDKNFNIGHNFKTKTFIFHKYIPYDKNFNMVP